GVRIEDVVERQFLAVQLLRGGDARRQRRVDAALGVEGGLLRWVFAVAQVGDFLEGERQVVGQRVVAAQVGADRGVVGGGVRECLLRQRAAIFERHNARGEQLQ